MVCLTGAAELCVDVEGPSLPVCPLVATMILLFRSISLSPSKRRTVEVSSLRRQVRFSHTVDHCYSLVVVQNIPDEPPKHASSCGVASSGRAGRLGGASWRYRASKSCLGGFLASLPYIRCSHLPIRYLLDCLSRARPLRHLTAFITTRAFYCSDSGPP